MGSANQATMPKAQGLRVRAVRILLGAFGWRLVGTPPQVARCVVVFAPHTSNWDFVLLYLVRVAFARHAAYLLKHTLFRFPLGALLRRTGAIPVERSEHHHLVEHLVTLLEKPSELWLALSPEGTRAKTDYWKSGFYHVARKARVPVLLAFVDARKKECGLGPLLRLTSDIEADLSVIRQFYQAKQGIVPEHTGEIRLHPGRN